MKITYNYLINRSSLMPLCFQKFQSHSCSTPVLHDRHAAFRRRKSPWPQSFSRLHSLYCWFRGYGQFTFLWNMSLGCVTLRSVVNGDNSSFLRISLFYFLNWINNTHLLMQERCFVFGQEIIILFFNGFI